MSSLRISANHPRQISDRYITPHHINTIKKAMTKKLRIDINLPDDFEIEKFKLGFVINLSFSRMTAKLIRNKKPFAPFHDRALQLQASIVEE